MSLREILVGAATECGADTAPGADGSLEWSIAGHPFAALDPAGATASFRLDPVLAGAARRTPDTGASPRGGEWVEFAPGSMDGHAEDRAVAWFLAGARRAAG